MNPDRQLGPGTRSRSWRILFTLLLVVPPPGPVSLHAQHLLPEAGLIDLGGDQLLFQSRILEREIEAATSLVGHADRYVVVHLGENRVFVFEGRRAIWSAPAGTGDGFRLAGGGQDWTFTTPRGLMSIRRMEKDPLWQAPDWYYVENGLRISAGNSPARMMRGVMGTTAIYLGDGIAIHGTNAPHLVLNPDPEARRVSHGCIRLTNEAARDLMHMVDVGTPVLIF